jgi:cation diffusion facilitator family transporter
MSMQNIMMRSFIVNIFLVIIKIIFGVIFGSVALIADGVHSISDLLSDIFVILGIKHSLKPADDDHPFGHGKFEYVLSFILGISILTIAINLGREIINKWDEVVKIPSIYSLIVVLAVILAKLVLARYLIRTGKEIDSEIIFASGKESLTDVISSFVVIFGIVSVLIGNRFNIAFLLKGDKIASIVISLFIIKIAVEIIYQAIVSLQGKAVKKEISEPYRKMIKSVKGVIDVDHMDMVAFGPYYQILVDISLNGDLTVKEGHDIAKEVSRILYASEKITHVVVHVNPEGEQ